MVAGKPITLTESPDNTEEQCDAVLGAYLRAWDQVEHQLLPIFNKMLGTHQNATLVLLSIGMNQPTLRSILESLAPTRLGKNDQKELTALIRRWETASAKRNRIVHGHWMLSIKMVPGPSGKLDHTKSTFIRSYSPANPTVWERIHGPKKDQKLVATHMFRLKDIEQFTNDVRKLARDMKSFVEQLSVLAFVDYLPINIEQ